MTRINYRKTSIEDLILCTQQSDFKATAELIKRIQKDIYTFFCHLCPPDNMVADLTQETLIKIVKNIKKLKDIKYFKNWCNRIAINVFYDALRKNDRREKYLEPNEQDLSCIEDKKCKPADTCQSKELDTQIKSCIINLPVNARVAIILRELQGLSYEEIAKLTNTNLGTVKSRISRAREKLQLELAGYL